MKPRLILPLTDEDHRIWRSASMRIIGLLNVSWDADRRDADLMLEVRESGAVSIDVWRFGEKHSYHVHSVWWEFGKMAWFCGRCVGHRATRVHHELCT